MIDGLTTDQLDGLAKQFDEFAAQFREAKRLVESHELGVAKGRFQTMLNDYLPFLIRNIPQLLERVKGQVKAKSLGIPSPEDLQIAQSARDPRTKRVDPDLWSKIQDNVSKTVAEHTKAKPKTKRRRK